MFWRNETGQTYGQMDRQTDYYWASTKQGPKNVLNYNYIFFTIVTFKIPLLLQ